MNIRQAYNNWAAQYDSDTNKTRDLEGHALREALAGLFFQKCLEIGCGTGKNTLWLLENVSQVVAVDFSEKMLAKAKEKVKSDNVQFHQVDITKKWTFADSPYDLVTCSLVLEHIEFIDDIIKKASDIISSNGYLYIGELHPFKQYSGSKARFETSEGKQIVPCFKHHISDFIQPALDHGFNVEQIKEYFDDDDDRRSIPRILSLLCRKK